MLEWGIARTTAATISGMSFLVKESVPLWRLAAGEEPEAEPVELVETEPEERVAVARRGVLRVVCCAGGSKRLARVLRVDCLACLAERPLIVCVSFFQ